MAGIPNTSSVSTNPTMAIGLSVGRTAVAFAMGVLVGKGVLNFATANEFFGYAVQTLPYVATAATALFGAYSHWKNKQDVKTVAANPMKAVP